MRPYDHIGVNSWILAGISGLVLTCNQACANGKTQQGNTDTSVTGGTDSSQGGVVNGGGAGGTTGLGGSTIGSAGTSRGGAASGGIGQGGTSSNVGGASEGGNLGTGGQANTSGGTGDGGNPATGGQGGATDNTGGLNSATGGSNSSTGGVAATGGTPGISCTTALNCVAAPNNQTACDSSTGTCVQCVIAADCGTNFDCLSKKCVSYVPCTIGTDCPSGACDTTRGRCVECTVDANCATEQKCVLQTCRIKCASDPICAPSTMLCNTTLGICAKCGCATCAQGGLTCAAGLVCDPTGLCAPPVCNAGDKICSPDNGGIAYCLSDGSAYGTPLPCPANSTCKASAGAVACYGDGGDGGIVDNCAVGGNPCQQIPKYTGTQIVDGLGDDFCSVPGVQFSAKNAAKIIQYHGVNPLEAATVRVAWSTAGLSAFIDVQDASVQVVSTFDATQEISKIYQGDSIELMISSSNSVSGLTGTDANTLHVTVPAAGPAVSVKTSNSSGASQGAYTALPAGQYAQKMTATGYAIELRLPWPGTAPAAGTSVRFDIALNSADKTFTSVDDMRDGQLIYYLGTVTGTTTCQGTGSDGNVPFCDDRIWCSTSTSP